MGDDLNFQCRCGAITGRLVNLSPARAMRFVCHCDDCQVSAHALGHGDMLDENGGTDAAIVDSSRLRIETGLDRLGAIRVADFKSRPIHRWHCAACNTPMFNTYDSNRRSFLSFVMATTDPDARDRLLGPSLGHIWRRFATGDLKGRKSVNLRSVIARIAWRQITARLSGDYRNTPLFDRKTGAPIAAPRILTAAERRAAEQIIAKNRSANATS